MNTPHPLQVSNLIKLDRDMMTPVDPHFYLNPSMARKIGEDYRANVMARINATPPGTQYYDSPAMRLLVQESPDVFADYLDKWFSPQTPIQTLTNATQIVYETNYVAGIEKANKEITRRLQEVQDNTDATELCRLAQWDPKRFVPQLQQLLNRMPHDPKIVYAVVISLAEYGDNVAIEIPKAASDIMMPWLASGNDNEKYVAVQGLSHTAVRETQTFGDIILSEIDSGNRLYKIGDAVFKDNAAPWVKDAFVKLKNGAKQEPQYASLLYKYGGETYAEFYRTQVKKTASADAFNALERTIGKEQAIEFVSKHLPDKPFPLACLLLDVAGESAIPACVDLLSKSTDEELHKNLIEQIAARKFGIGNTELLEVVEKVYENACESDFRVHARRLLNALKRLGHSGTEELAERLPGPDSFESPFVTMAENDQTIHDFVNFLNARQTKPIDATTLGQDLEVTTDHFTLNCRIHDALLQTPYAMEFCPEDWNSLGALDALYEELVLMSEGKFVPDGIRLSDKIEIGWRDVAFADTLAPYESCSWGVIDMLNAILDHSGDTTYRYISYANERGNEYPTIAFLSEADVKAFETQFGLKPN